MRLMARTKKYQTGGVIPTVTESQAYSPVVPTMRNPQVQEDTDMPVSITEMPKQSKINVPPEFQNTTKMAKGGMMQDGGLLQEGGTVDPESGNDVPVGANQEEVRDDIPAKLSEGEFVFPADVVRFIGLERLMKMRQAAKEGLAKMDAMGQMGNSEEATMSDGADTEFESEIDDILEEIEKESENS